MIPHLIESNNFFSQDFDQKIKLSSNKEAAILLRFLKHLRISKLFSQLSDKRQQSKTNYSNTSLSLWAFFTLLFRQGSKNSFRTTLEGISCKKRKAISAFLMTDDTLPHSSTVDDYLCHLDAEQLNDVLFGIFQRAQTTKVFYNHVSILMPDNRFLLGCDGFHTHTYSKPHSVDEHGNNICPYCLPRRRNKGTPQEEVYWVHVLITFVIIFRGGLKIPIYIYPLKACQVNEGLSDEAFKQECELKATHAVLPIIKNKFPHTAFTFCGDALYANEPTIQLLNSLFFEYLIVRKEKLTIWKLMLFIAFSVFELFICLKLVQDACERRSWMKFSRDLLHQLVYEDWGEISNSPILQKEKVQFRFCFEKPS